MNVVDSKNISYEVLEKLGEGSQGVTYLLKDKKHIVKLFNQSFDDNTTKSKINFLINLGLDKKVFAVPLRQITQPKNGYVSEFASGMIPLSSLKLGTENTNLAEWYLSSGGLLKRYNVLIRLAALTTLRPAFPAVTSCSSRWAAVSTTWLPTGQFAILACSCRIRGSSTTT